MKILLIHNFYRTPGGEDRVFSAEVDLLRDHGHAVKAYTLHNREIDKQSSWRLGASAIWSRRTYADLTKVIRQFGPDVAHFHNTFPLISPSAYYACRVARVPVVQTLHNYRLLCPAATLYRAGRPCENCLGAPMAWRSVLHSCYRRSALASGAVATMLTAHRVIGTWTEAVDVYVALTEFSRSKFLRGGLPEARVAVKPNFLARDPGVGSHDGDYAMFVGRASPEKGLGTLLRAWSAIGSALPLKVAGGWHGPATASGAPPGVEYLGPLENERVLEMMKRAVLLVFPSECYENFPITLIEALATGLPVVASRHGAMLEILQDGRTGFLFQPGEADDLVTVLRQAMENPERRREVGWSARREFEHCYTAEVNHTLLTRIYLRARDAARA